MHPSCAAGILAGLKLMLESDWRPAAGDRNQRAIVVHSNALLGLIHLLEQLGYSEETILQRAHKRLREVELTEFNDPSNQFSSTSASQMARHKRMQQFLGWSIGVRHWLCDQQLEAISIPDRVQAGIAVLDRIVPFWPLLVRKKLCLSGKNVLEQLFHTRKTVDSAEAIHRMGTLLGVVPGPGGYNHWWFESHGYYPDYSNDHEESNRRKRELGRLWWQAAVQRRFQLISTRRVPVGRLRPQLPVVVHDRRHQVLYWLKRCRWRAEILAPYDWRPGIASLDGALVRDVLLENSFGVERRWRVESILRVPGKGVQVTLSPIRPAK